MSLEKFDEGTKETLVAVATASFVVSMSPRIKTCSCGGRPDLWNKA